MLFAPISSSHSAHPLFACKLVHFPQKIIESFRDCHVIVILCLMIVAEEMFQSSPLLIVWPSTKYPGRKCWRLPQSQKFSTHSQTMRAPTFEWKNSGRLCTCTTHTWCLSVVLVLKRANVTYRGMRKQKLFSSLLSLFSSKTQSTKIEQDFILLANILLNKLNIYFQKTPKSNVCP